MRTKLTFFRKTFRKLTNIFKFSLFITVLRNIFEKKINLVMIIFYSNHHLQRTIDIEYVDKVRDTCYSHNMLLPIGYYDAPAPMTLPHPLPWPWRNELTISGDYFSNLNWRQYITISLSTYSISIRSQQSVVSRKT